MAILKNKAELNLKKADAISRYYVPGCRFNSKMTFQYESNKFAFVDFCAVKRQQSMARARMEVVKIAPQIGIVRAESARVAIRIRLSPKCHHIIHLILWFGVCAGGTS